MPRAKQKPEAPASEPYGGESGATWTNQKAPTIQPDPSCEVCHGTGWEPAVEWSHPRGPRTRCLVEKMCRRCRKVERR